MIPSPVAPCPETASREAAILQGDREASAKTLRGIELLEKGDPLSLIQASALFEEAIAIRQELPWRQQPWICYGLAAGWMNRGDAFTRLKEKSRLAEAKQSYDRALEILQHLPEDSHLLFRQRHVIAWTNRGQTLMALEDVSGAIRSFRQALAFLTDSVCQEPSFRLLRAGIDINLGNALLSLTPPSARLALTSTRKALETVREFEADHPEAAETAFQGRLVLCRAVAFLLEMENLSAHEFTSLTTEATEAVEEGLCLGRHWEARGQTRFTPLLLDLFRFGARIYQLYQPRFLGEYLLEAIETPGASDVHPSHLHGLAMEAMGREMASIQRSAFTSWNSPRFENLLARVRALREVEERLLQLRTTASPDKSHS